MFNKGKIKELEKQIVALKNDFDVYVGGAKREQSRLSFLLNNPLLFKVGDKPFKDIVITNIENKYLITGYTGHYYTPVYGWSWEIKAFDIKNKKEIYLQLDCGNKLVNPNLPTPKNNRTIIFEG